MNEIEQLKEQNDTLRIQLATAEVEIQHVKNIAMQCEQNAAIERHRAEAAAARVKELEDQVARYDAARAQSNVSKLEHEKGTTFPAGPIDSHFLTGTNVARLVHNPENVPASTWYKLSSITKDGELLELLAASCEDGIGIIAHWTRNDSGGWHVEAVDTESCDMEIVTDFHEGEPVPPTPPVCAYAVPITPETKGDT